MSVYNEAYNRVVRYLNPLFDTINQVTPDKIQDRMKAVREERISEGAEDLSQDVWNIMFRELVTTRSEIIKNRIPGSLMTLLKWPQKRT